MGADLIVATIVEDQARPIAWEQARDAVMAMPLPRFQECYLGAFGEHEEEALAREHVVDLFDAVRTAIEEGDRGVTSIEVRGLTIYIAGGMSWGDDPSEAFTEFSNVGHFPEVCHAIGFRRRESIRAEMRESEDW